MTPPIQLGTKGVGDWFALSLSNGIVSLAVVPGIGGRVMELSLGETPVFYTNPRLRGKALEGDKADLSLGKNFGGSKVWPGPQGWSSENEWPGPPDPVIDCGRYEWSAALQPHQATIELQSPHDEYTGITMRREIRLTARSGSIELLHTMENTSRRPVRWSIWQVTQVDAPQGLEIVVPGTGFRQTFGDKPYPAVSYNTEERRIHLKYIDQVAKLAVEADRGWFASLDRSRGYVLAETFPLVPGASYPDGAAVAFWISGRGTFTLHGDQVDMGGAPGGCDPHVETEIMSPITELRPGESCTLRTAWHLATVDADRILSVNECGVVATCLSLEAGTPARLTGSFGVFHEAHLELIAYDRASEVLRTFGLGEVSPNRAVLLDRSIDLPANTVRCSLLLIDSNHRQLGVLDRVNILG